MTKKNFIVILNDHEVQGLGSFGVADTIELATIRRGSQGDIMPSAVPQRGGPISLALQPDSPSLIFFLHQAKAQIEGNVVLWNGCVKDLQHGCILRLERGFMTQAPMGALVDPEANKTFTFEFERIRYELV